MPSGISLQPLTAVVCVSSCRWRQAKTSKGIRGARLVFPPENIKMTPFSRSVRDESVHFEDLNIVSPLCFRFKFLFL